jgi:geranylgeranyl pyrophosphate synthase
MNPLTVCQPVPLAKDRSEINRYLENLLCAHGQAAGRSVSDAMRYAVLGSAQRIRPVLSLRIARLFGAPHQLTLAAAGAVELLHCASLIVDDLPCMDDSPFRRDRASVHVEFGESTAILAAFALVALAARSVMETPCADVDRERAIEFQLALLRTLDCCGLIAGQAMDLANAASNGHRADLDISDLKTVPLFTLAVQAGSLVEIENADSRAVLSGFGREFGLAFQMSDDLLDGEEEDAQPFLEKLSMLRALVAHFGPAARDIESLIDYLNDRVSSHKNCQQSFR